MSLIQFNGVYKQFNGKDLLENINFNINIGDKIGLIGLNGAGKSTILKLILNIENPDKGNIFVYPKLNIGYLSQNIDFYNEDNDVYNELYSCFEKQKHILDRLNKISKDNIEEHLKLNQEFLSLGGYDIEYKIKQVMEGLQLNTFKDKPIKKLSGGEKTRIALAKLILKESDLLILDEPTNHLDILSIKWLEEYLSKNIKTYILISHDRVFLDKVTNRIFEIENRKLEMYKGNFSSFLTQKEMILKGKLTAYEKETKKIKELEAFIEKYRAGIKSKMARGRQKLLDKIAIPENPNYNIKKMKLDFPISSNTGTNVLEVKNISKKFEDKLVLNNVSFNLYKGDKVAIIGKNGIGKSTLLKILLNKIKADNGSYIISETAKISYYDQNQEDLNPNNTLIEEINTNISYTKEYLLSKLASFLFSVEDENKKISYLSGGEKVRVALLKLSELKNNVLFLDEPTNHLDLYSLEILENALINFEGSILLISHNRHFINSICNKIYFLSEDGLTEFNGNYEQFESKKELVDKTNQKESYFKRKELQKQEIKRQKDIEKIENEINEISTYLQELESEMLKFGNNLSKVMEIQEKIDITKKREDELFEKLEEISY